jgi:DNA/RNA-binding protein KIN17
MERFSSDANRYVETFSRDFEKAFVDVLSNHHHTKRMNANYVYNEMIQDKTHVHMSATRWDSLANFVKHLGATGKCVVDETEQGWFVKWIDPEERKRELDRKKRSEEEARTLERRTQALLKRQKEVSDSHSNTEEGVDESVAEIVEQDWLPFETKAVVTGVQKKPKVSGPLSIFSATEPPMTAATDDSVATQHQAVTVVDTITWLLPDIVVKIVSSKVGPGLKNEKAVVLDVMEDQADLIMLKSGLDVQAVSSKRLETVIPKVGGKVMVLGLHPKRGKHGTIESLNQDDCSAIVRLSNGETEKFEFEDISKVFENSEA